MNISRFDKEISFLDKMFVLCRACHLTPLQFEAPCQNQKLMRLITCSRPFYTAIQDYNVNCAKREE